jgi:hypothetical protein
MLVKIISIMLKNTYTTDELMERLALMRTYYGKRLFSGGEDAVLQDVVGHTCDTATLRALEEWQHAFHESDISPLVVYEALDTIEEDLTGIPSVTLYVPIHFTAEHMQRFGEWFRNNVQPNMLLTVRTDTRMAGGCGFIWHDTFYDFSLRYHVDAHRDEIVGRFNAYTHG